MTHPGFDISVQAESPRDARVVALLRQSHALMRRLYAPEDIHALDIDALCAPGITLFLAQDGTRALGCVALKRTAEHGEVKSFFVDPAARGCGAGRALMAHLESVARDEGLAWLKLETGVGLDAAARLYRAAGFVSCAPFGSYRAGPASLFFEKRLDQSR